MALDLALSCTKAAVAGAEGTKAEAEARRTVRNDDTAKGPWGEGISVEVRGREGWTGSTEHALASGGAYQAQGLSAFFQRFCSSTIPHYK